MNEPSATDRVALLWLEWVGFEGTDVDLETSLVEYGIARHAESGLTILGGKADRGGDYTSWYVSDINHSEVSQAVDEVDTGFFSFIGVDEADIEKYKHLVEEGESYLTVSTISDLNMWNGYFLRHDGSLGTSLAMVACAVAQDLGISFNAKPRRRIYFEALQTDVTRVAVEVIAEDGEHTHDAVRRAIEGEANEWIVIDTVGEPINIEWDTETPVELIRVIEDSREANND